MDNWLINLRNKKELTQDEVAKLAEMPRTTYSSIEQGRRRPSVENAMRIASVLGFDWTYFLKRKYAKRRVIRRWSDERQTTNDSSIN